MDDMKKWIGKKFIDFCRSDPEDDRDIHYVMMTYGMNGSLEFTAKFTSKQIVSMETMSRIRKSVIRDIALADNMWHVSLEYKEDAEMQEIKLSKLKRLEAEKQEFKQMYAELFPHLSIVADILEKYRDVGTIGKDGNVNIYIGKNGYISVGDFLEGWSLLRVNRDADPEIVCEVREKVEG